MDRNERFEKMIERFKKTSRDKNREAEKCHSKSEGKKKKAKSAEQRKIAAKRKSNGK